MLLFGGPDINAAVEEFRHTPDALLVDVREPDEYRSGHIPGSVNLPLSGLSGADVPRRRPLFVYCLRGTRSRRAVGLLKRMGCEDARSIGGIAAYRGPLER